MSAGNGFAAVLEAQLDAGMQGRAAKHVFFGSR